MTDILSIGASATMLYQKSLATVSNNVANLHTEGYSRQEAISLENNPSEYGVHYVGTGAYLGSIQRNYDAFVERNLSTALNQLSSHVSMNNYTTRLVDSIASESTALAPAFDKFFVIAEKLSTEPFSTPMRLDLLSAADFLTGRIRDFAQNLTKLDNESAQELESTVSQVNVLTSQLADINRQLQKNSTLARQPMAVLDQRDKVLKELSAFIGTEVTEKANGQVDVRVKDSGPQATLVSGDRSKALSVNLVANRPGSQVVVLDEYGDNKQLLNLQGGSVSGLASFRSDVLAPLMSQIEVMAATFITRVNNVNRDGLTLGNEIGGDVFKVERRFNVTDTNNSPVSGTRVSQTRELEKEVNVSIAWLGGNTWQITDLDSKKSQSVVAMMEGNSLALPSVGLAIQFGKTPLRGEAIIVKSDLSAAHGIKLAISDGSQFAFGEKYYVGQATTNQRTVETSLIPGGQLPVSGLAAVPALSSFVSKNVPLTTTTSSVRPALVVPQGASEFVVSFRPAVGSDAQLQVFTADFNHLLGADLSQNTGLTDAMRTAAFDANSRYINSNRQETSVGSFAYRGSTVFYGHKATGFAQSVDIPSVTGAAGGTNLIAGGALKINGQVLTGPLALNAGESLSAQKVADWFNTNVGAIATAQRPAVLATVVSVPVTDQRGNVMNDATTGVALSKNVVRFVGDQVQFSFAQTGKPSDLSVLGLNTGVYGSGAAAEKLLIYATATTDVQTDLQINVPAHGMPNPRVELNKPAVVSFSMINNQLHYDLKDQQGLVIARRRFDAAAGVALPGMSLKFDRSPATGDVFNVQVNANAASDNRNLLKLIAVSDEKLVNQQTLQQYYLTMVNTVGNVKDIASMNKETAQIIHDHAVEQKSKIAGVNLDQEAADLIRFQQAYQASAQVIQASIKLFDTLLSTSR